MVASRVILDANMLLLLAYGSVCRSSLGKKRRVREYVPQDYELTLDLVSRFRQVVVTPNVVTECSDLFGDESDEKEKLWLKEFVKNGEMVRVEEYVPSREAVGLRQYDYLGVADCSLLSLVDPDTVLLTADAKLYYEAAKITPFCMNFNHWRDFT